MLFITLFSFKGFITKEEETIKLDKKAESMSLGSKTKVKCNNIEYGWPEHIFIETTLFYSQKLNMKMKMNFKHQAF